MSYTPKFLALHSFVLIFYVGKRRLYYRDSLAIIGRFVGFYERMEPRRYQVFFSLEKQKLYKKTVI